MGVAYYIVAEKKEFLDEIFVNGKLFATYCDTIGRIAEENDLPRPESFVCMPKEAYIDILEDEFDLQPDQDFMEKIPKESWFDPKEGLDYIESLISLVKKELRMNENTRKNILEGLKEFIKPFEYLIKNNCEWHFQIDI
jgi:hypothetical protein